MTKIILAHIAVILAAIPPLFFFLYPSFGDGTNIIAIYGTLGIIFTTIFAAIASRLSNYI
jgi:hypothetical protein